MAPLFRALLVMVTRKNLKVSHLTGFSARGIFTVG
jgi:hypothetical protein